MKTIFGVFALSIMTTLILSCGPNCYKEELELTDCLNLTVASALVCNQQAAQHSDATLRLAKNSECTTGLFAGMVLCETQRHAYCRY